MDKISQTLVEKTNQHFREQERKRKLRFAIRVIDHDVPGVVLEHFLVRRGQTEQAVDPIVNLGLDRDQARREIVMTGLPGAV